MAPIKTTSSEDVARLRDGPVHRQHVVGAADVQRHSHRYQATNGDRQYPGLYEEDVPPEDTSKLIPLPHIGELNLDHTSSQWADGASAELIEESSPSKSTSVDSQPPIRTPTPQDPHTPPKAPKGTMGRGEGKGTHRRDNEVASKPPRVHKCHNDDPHCKLRLHHHGGPQNQRIDQFHAEVLYADDALAKRESNRKGFQSVPCTDPSVSDKWFCEGIAPRNIDDIRANAIAHEIINAKGPVDLSAALTTAAGEKAHRMALSAAQAAKAAYIANAEAAAHHHAMTTEGVVGAVLLSLFCAGLSGCLVWSLVRRWWRSKAKARAAAAEHGDVELVVRQSRGGEDEGEDARRPRGEREKL
jgi:hypothetical protein